MGSFGGTGSIMLGVSRDGRRVFGPKGSGLQGRTPECSQRFFFNGNFASTPISRRGTFQGDFETNSYSGVRLSGTFSTGGMLRGEVLYGERGDCGAMAAFTARAAPRQDGISQRSYDVTSDSSRPPVDGTAATAVLITPAGLDELPDGSLLVSERSSRGGAIRRIDPAGRVRTEIGRDAGLSGPADVAVLRGGGYLVADPGQNCVLRVSPQGSRGVAAGRCGSVGAASGDGGPATAATLEAPQHLALTADGGFLVSEGDVEEGIYADNRRVRRVASDGTITTVAGSGLTGSAGDGGPAVAASFTDIDDLAVQPDGGFLVADRFRVRRVAPDGTVDTVAGTGFPGYSADGGPATGAHLYPRGLASRPGGGFLISDGADRLRLVSAAGTIHTIAGQGEGDAGTPAEDGALDAGNLKLLRNGAIATAGFGISLIAGRHERRLLVGLPGPRGMLRGLLRRRRPVSIAVTRRALARVEIRVRARVVMRTRRRLRPGVTTVRLPRAFFLPRSIRGRGTPVPLLRVVVTSGRRIATITRAFFY